MHLVWKSKKEAVMDDKVTFKVGQKGGCSAYGLGRFPVTLYRDQWVKLLDAKEELLVFLEQHASELKTKP
jgi:hypothetical protein